MPIGLPIFSLLHSEPSLPFSFMKRDKSRSSLGGAQTSCSSDPELCSMTRQIPAIPFSAAKMGGGLIAAVPTNVRTHPSHGTKLHYSVARWVDGFGKRVPPTSRVSSWTIYSDCSQPTPNHFSISQYLSGKKLQYHLQTTQRQHLSHSLRSSNPPRFGPSSCSRSLLPFPEELKRYLVYDAINKTSFDEIIARPFYLLFGMVRKEAEESWGAVWQPTVSSWRIYRFLWPV